MNQPLISMSIFNFIRKDIFLKTLETTCLLNFQYRILSINCSEKVFHKKNENVDLIYLEK